MRETFRDKIKEINLFQADNYVLLAVSGGLDSVVMSHLFHAEGYHIGIAHCNFKLRAADADADETFTRVLAQRFGVQFYSVSFDTQAYAQQHGISIQMAARDLRYEWFERVRIENGYDYIATAHHADDQAETVLINLARGTGLAGLQGFKPKSDRIVRPMWHFTRRQIESYASQHHIAHREDISNSETKYIRNKIRHQIIPLFEEINPSFGISLSRLSAIAEDTHKLLDFFVQRELPAMMQQKGDSMYVDIDAIKAFPSIELLLYEILKPYGFTSAVVKEIADGVEKQPGKMFYSPTHSCLKDRDHLIISPLKQSIPSELILVEKNEHAINTPFGKFIFSIHTDFSSSDIRPDPFYLYADIERLTFPLTLRHPARGDYFYPLGMSGKKKISDYLTDKKIPLTQKEKVWLLCSTDKVCWIAGMRCDERFKITHSTREVFTVNYIPYDE